MSKGTKLAKGGNKTPSKQKIYAQVAHKGDEVLGVLFERLHSRNEAISLGAAKVLINKILPDLKSSDLTTGGEKIEGIIVYRPERKDE